MPDLDPDDPIALQLEIDVALTFERTIDELFGRWVPVLRDDFRFVALDDDAIRRELVVRVARSFAQSMLDEATRYERDQDGEVT